MLKACCELRQPLPGKAVLKRKAKRLEIYVVMLSSIGEVRFIEGLSFKIYSDSKNLKSVSLDLAKILNCCVLKV